MPGAGIMQPKPCRSEVTSTNTNEATIKSGSFRSNGYPQASLFIPYNHDKLAFTSIAGSILVDTMTIARCKLFKTIAMA